MEQEKNKPVHVKPSIYTIYFQTLKEIARSHGYNLLIHGSMNRDMDLVAVPWVDNPYPELTLIQSMAEYLTGHTAHEDHWKEIYMYSILPGGRSSYVININRAGTPDPQYYLDISVTPLVKR